MNFELFRKTKKNGIPGKKCNNPGFPTSARNGDNRAVSKKPSIFSCCFSNKTCGLEIIHPTSPRCRCQASNGFQRIDKAQPLLGSGTFLRCRKTCRCWWAIWFLGGLMNFRRCFQTRCWYIMMSYIYICIYVGFLKTLLYSFLKDFDPYFLESYICSSVGWYGSMFNASRQLPCHFTTKLTGWGAGSNAGVGDCMSMASMAIHVVGVDTSPDLPVSLDSDPPDSEAVLETVESSTGSVEPWWRVLPSSETRFTCGIRLQDKCLDVVATLFDLNILEMMMSEVQVFKKILGKNHWGPEHVHYLWVAVSKIFELLHKFEEGEPILSYFDKYILNVVETNT